MSEQQSPADEVSFHPPVEPSTLERAKEECGVAFPTDYLAFLSRANGGEGFLANGAYVVLWKAEELRQFNDDYQVEEDCPGFFAFGSNGSGEGYVFDFRTEPVRIGQIPFIGMETDVAWIIAETFSAFFASDWLPGIWRHDK